MTWFELLLLPENLLWAWRKVQRCYGMADSLFDQAEIAAFDLNLENELASIKRDFETGNWENRPIRLIPQPKKPSKEGKPRLRQYFDIAVRDQVAWIAIVNVLGPELDQKMPAWSYGNRLYRAAWYEEEPQDGRHSKLNIGPYRHSAGYLYRHFKHSCDFLDLERIAMYRGKVQHLFILALNKDATSFRHVAEAIARMVFCNVIICNCGHFGGSLAVSPYRLSERRTIYQHAGPRLATAQIIEMPVERLHLHQKGGDPLKDGIKEFKSLPPGFQFSVALLEKLAKVV